MERKGFYDFGLPSEFISNYQDLNNGKKIELFDWQKEVLNIDGLLEGNENLLYSAPTSAGKTIVSEILVAKKVTKNENKKAILIYPFIALAREKYTSLKILFRYTNVRVGCFAGGSKPKGGIDSFDILICTMEKANNIINYLYDENKLSNIGIVVIDEIHLLSDPSRGVTLELLCAKLLRMDQIQIIGMSATVPNLTQLGRWLKAKVYETDFRPVPLKVQLCYSQKLWDIVDGRQKLARVIELENCVASLNIKIPEERSIASLVTATVNDGHQAMIFCSTKKWCETLAVKFATYFKQIETTHPNVLKLEDTKLKELRMSLIENGVKQSSKILTVTEAGVAFHHAGMLNEEKDVIENFFRNNAIKLLISTTTLASGVNLPARLVIIRNCLDPLGKNLISTRQFKQMCGRAGRKGVDDSGHAVLIANQKEFKLAKDLMSRTSEDVVSALTTNMLKVALLGNFRNYEIIYFYFFLYRSFIKKQ
jgi:DNA polymerase theta